MANCTDLAGPESDLASAIGRAMYALTDPEKAEGMRKYMKDRFEYLGVAMPERRAALKPFLKWAQDLEIDGLALCLYEQPYRELHYAALDLLEHYLKSAPEQRIVLYEQLMMQSQWWDSIDWIASKLLGAHFARYPHLIPEYYEKWMESGDIWLQRSCLLFQLHYKSDLDQDLLVRTIHALHGSDEFFIQKAIGWILRQYARTNPDWVRDFVALTALKPLSRREASKHL